MLGQARCRFLAIAVCLVLLAAGLQGCILAHIGDSVQRAGVTESGRRRLLQEAVKDFHNAIYWGKPNRAAAYVVPERRQEVARQLHTMRRKERIVETNVDFVSYGPDARSAEVDVMYKYYRVPMFVVNERLEREQWTFSMSTGWLLEERAVVDLETG